MGDFKTLLLSVAICVAALAAGIALNFLISFLLDRHHSRSSFTVRGVPVNPKYWRGPRLIVLPVLSLALALPFLEFSERTTFILRHAVTLSIIGSFGWLIVRTIAMARDVILSRFDIEASDNLQARRVSTQIRVLERVADVVVVTLTIAIMLMTFQTVRQIGVSIVASAGVLGLVIGFAAQRSLTTILAGVQIAITQPIRLEDAVVVEGEWGWIEEITLTFVVVKLWDERRLIVPITHFIEKPFQNWTRTTAELIGTVFIYTDYTVPVPELRTELQRIVESSDFWDGRVCSLQVTNSTNEGMEIRALASAADSPRTWDLRCYVREHMLNFIRRRFPESLPRSRVQLDRNHKGRTLEPGRHVFTATT
jgi:small-conductance mechanosensitive channel